MIAFHDVSFSYSGKKEEYLYAKLNFGIDLDSRIALVGPNGAGTALPTVPPYCTCVLMGLRRITLSRGPV